MSRAMRLLLPVFWTLLCLLPVLLLTGYSIEHIYEAPLKPGGFRFERPWAGLLLLGALLVLVARGYLRERSLPRLSISRGRDLKAIRPGWRVWFKDVLVGLRVSSVLLMGLALMGAQSIHARDSSSTKGIDIVLALDMSLSMQAEDIRPNRFEATQSVVQGFIARRPNDRMGAVVFGKDAYTLMPLTSDKEALRQVIREMQLELIDGRGTAIGNAVGTSLNRLRKSEAKSKVIILLTDGLSNAGNVSPDQAAELAAAMKVKVFSILMGQSDRAKVSRGRGLIGQLTDVGNFPINPDLLESMAKRTDGEFFKVSDRNGLEQSFHEILNRLEKSEIEDAGRVYGELYPAFLWPAFILLALELLLGMLLFRRWP